MRFIFSCSTWFCANSCACCTFTCLLNIEPQQTRSVCRDKPNVVIHIVAVVCMHCSTYHIADMMRHGIVSRLGVLKMNVSLSLSRQLLSVLISGFRFEEPSRESQPWLFLPAHWPDFKWHRGYIKHWYSTLSANVIDLGSFTSHQFANRLPHK